MVMLIIKNCSARYKRVVSDHPVIIGPDAGNIDSIFPGGFIFYFIFNLLNTLVLDAMHRLKNVVLQLHLRPPVIPTSFPSIVNSA